jgi:hypothetical protein
MVAHDDWGDEHLLYLRSPDAWEAQVRDKATAEMPGLWRAAEERQRERQRERRRRRQWEWQEPELGAGDAFDKELRDTARSVDGADDYELGPWDYMCLVGRVEEGHNESAWVVYRVVGHMLRTSCATRRLLVARTAEGLVRHALDEWERCDVAEVARSDAAYLAFCSDVIVAHFRGWACRRRLAEDPNTDVGSRPSARRSPRRSPGMQGRRARKSGWAAGARPCWSWPRSR